MVARRCFVVGALGATLARQVFTDEVARQFGHVLTAEDRAMVGVCYESDYTVADAVRVLAIRESYEQHRKQWEKQHAAT